MKSPEQEQRIKLAIRDEIARNPLIATHQLQSRLLKRGFQTTSGNPLDWHYLAKLIRKLNREKALAVDSQKIQERLAITKESYRLIIQSLWRIIDWQPEDVEQYHIWPPKNDERIKAANTLIKLNLAILKAEMDAGIFERKLGEVDINIHRAIPLPPETTAKIAEAFIRWGIQLLPNDVRILARSRGQKIRGLKHRQYRPRAVVIDDPEDLKWVRTKENRDFTENWLNSEVIPGLDRQTRKLVVLINNLHMDALAARIRAKGTFHTLEYPSPQPANGWFDCIWKSQYPNQASLDAERKRVGEVAWQREYLLKVVAEEDQIIKPEDSHYYDELPMLELRDSQGNPQMDAEAKPARAPILAAIKGHGIDLAISQSANADSTTDVKRDVFYQDDAPKIYILVIAKCLAR